MGTERKKEGFDQNSIDELLELLALEETIRKLDLDKALNEKIERLSEKDRMIHELMEKDPELPRRIREIKVPPKKKKEHWKTRQKREREYNRQVRAPRVRERKAAMLKERGWYPILKQSWDTHKLDVILTEDEWNEVVGPAVGDKAPIIHRYDATGPISLENIWVETKDRKVVYDGMEYKLLLLGYTI